MATTTEAVTVQSHRDEIRAAELAWAARRIGAPCRVLEVGSGNGKQAAALEKAGHAVVGIDVPGGRYGGSEVRTVVYYDGQRFPVRSGSVDRVFSSHVLEHVEDRDGVLAEERRVLHDGGYAVNIMPTATWRLATIVTRYLVLARALVRRLVGRPSAPQAAGSGTGAGGRVESPSLRSLAVPSRHGARGSAWSEVYLFSERAWRRELARNGWTVEEVEGSGLFYSGNHLMGDRLDVAARRRLARLLGSSSKLYVCRPRGR